jgi:hypothetical protein
LKLIWIEEIQKNRHKAKEGIVLTVFDFYVSCFGGKLRSKHAKRTTDKKRIGELENSILHVTQDGFGVGSKF